MKPIKKPSISKPSDDVTAQTTHRKTVIKLHVVSEKERELYRVPSYGYLIP